MNKKESNQKIPRRNGMIEIMRFLVSLMIIGYHCRKAKKLPWKNQSCFVNSFIGVEFFFIVSGYLMGKSIERAKTSKINIFKDTLIFIWRKVKSLLIIHFLANIITLVIIINVHDYVNLKKRILNGLPGLFLVQMIDVWDNETNEWIEAEWYISSMLISMFFIYLICISSDKKFKWYIGIIFSMVFFAVITLIYGLIRKWRFTYNYTQNIRAYCEIVIGIIGYQFIKAKLNPKIEISNITYYIISCLEILGYILFFVFMHISLNGIKYTILYGLTTIFLIISIFLSFSQKGNKLIHRLCCNKVVYYLGILSLPIYLFHTSFVNLYSYKISNFPLALCMFIIFLSSIMFSIIYQTIYDKLNEKTEPQTSESKVEIQKKENINA